MVGRIRKNSDPNIFFLDGKMIFKPLNNKDQGKIQINDWVFGQIDDDVLGGWSKYKGGDTNNKASYDTSDSINPQNFADI